MEARVCQWKPIIRGAPQPAIQWEVAAGRHGEFIPQDSTLNTILEHHYQNVSQPFARQWVAPTTNMQGTMTNKAQSWVLECLCGVKAMMASQQHEAPSTASTDDLRDIYVFDTFAMTQRSIDNGQIRMLRRTQIAGANLHGAYTRLDEPS